MSTAPGPPRARGGGETIDVLHLLDRLEEAISTGWKIPFTSRVAVNEQDLVELSDSIRSAVPDELRQAQQIVQERDALLAEAEEEARRLVDTAKRHADALVSEQGLLETANREARLIVQQAKEQAQAIVGDADAYGLDSLNRLETQLTQTLATVRNGIATLRENSPSDRQSDTT
jgi:cell division septum initiation protein DivIVA